MTKLQFFMLYLNARITACETHSIGYDNLEQFLMVNKPTYLEEHKFKIQLRKPDSLTEDELEYIFVNFYMVKDSDWEHESFKRELFINHYITANRKYVKNADISLYDIMCSEKTLLSCYDYRRSINIYLNELTEEQEKEWVEFV